MGKGHRHARDIPTIRSCRPSPRTSVRKRRPSLSTRRCTVSVGTVYCGYTRCKDELSPTSRTLPLFKHLTSPRLALLTTITATLFIVCREYKSGRIYSVCLRIRNQGYTTTHYFQVGEFNHLTGPTRHILTSYLKQSSER